MQHLIQNLIQHLSSQYSMHLKKAKSRIPKTEKSPFKLIKNLFTKLEMMKKE